MLKKRKVKAIYITEGVCDECGGRMNSTGMCLTTYPAQYPYKCEDCGHSETYWEYNKPGKLEYEFEEEDLPPAFPELIEEIFIDNNPLKTLNNALHFIHTTDTAIVEEVQYV